MSLADKLNFLFDKVRRPDGVPYTNEQVAAFISEYTGERRDEGYLSLLRNGELGNPTRKVLDALGAFFTVDPAIFTDGERSRRIITQINLAVKLRDESIREMALNLLAQVCEEDLGVVVDVICSVVERRS